MPISNEDVRHIAGLARIRLTNEEERKFEEELSSILKFVGKLSEIDAAGVMSETGGTRAENVMREDHVGHSELEGKSRELLDSVPEREKDWVKVKAVFE